MGVRYEQARFIGSYLKSLVSYPVFSAFFAPLRNCNIKCAYCYQVNMQTGVMSREIFSNRLDFLRERGLKVAMFTGGEIMLWEPLWDVLTECKSKRIFTVIATNGTLLTKKQVNRMSQSGVTHLSVSVDSVRRTPVSPKTLEDNPHLLDVLNYARNEKGLTVTCNAVLTRKNIDGVTELAGVLTEIDVPLSIGFVDTLNANLAFEMSRDQELLEETAAKIAEAKKKGNVIIEPDTYFRDFQHHLRGHKVWQCTKNKLRSVSVDPNGRFMVCNRLNDSIGFEELWSLQEVKQLKDRISEIINRCQESCYANCAYYAAHCRNHPVETLLRARKLRMFGF